MKMLNINLVDGNGNVNGTTTKSGGVSRSTNRQGPILTFNPFVEFF